MADQSLFRSERPPARGTSISMRLNEEQQATLDHLAERLGISKSELLRTALDYWITNSPDARRAARGR